MVSLTVALRGLGRNKRRVAVTTMAVAFAGWIMLVYAALFDGFLLTFERSITSFEIGDLQLHKEGYRRDPDLYTQILDGEALADRLTKQGLPAAPRLYSFALAASGDSSAGVELRGMDVAREQRVTKIDGAVRDGSWLSKDDPKGVVIGNKLARSLGVNVGGEVMLLGQASDGSVANDLYQVRGILKSVSERADRGGFFMTQAAFRELMVLPAHVAHELVLSRGDLTLEGAEARAAELKGDLELKTWRELNPAISQMLDSSQAGIIIMFLITYGAVGMVVLNATLMSVFERIREFGIMKAIGVTPAQVGLIVFLETMFQTTIAAAVALATGVPTSLYLQNHGWDLSAWGGTMNVAGIAWEPIWYAVVSTNSIVQPILAMFLIVGVSALYPGIKAAVISPIKAIHHN